MSKLGGQARNINFGALRAQIGLFLGPLSPVGEGSIGEHDFAGVMRLEPFVFVGTYFAIPLWKYVDIIIVGIV